MYGTDNPFKYILSETELNNIKAEELCTYIHNLVKYPHKVFYYGPENSKTIKTILNQKHNSVATKLTLPPAKVFVKREIIENELYFANYDMVQAEIAWYRRLDKVDQSKDAIITLFNEYFGGGMSSLVFQTIRESKALAYSTYSYYNKGNEPGEYDGISAYIGAQADKLPEAIPAMNELLDKLPESEILLANCKASIKSQIENNRTIGTNILFAFDNAVKWGYKEDPSKAVYQNIDKITFKDLENFHTSCYSKKPYAYFLISKSDNINMADLEKFGKLRILTFDELFGY